jgi:uncharacterized membrane protein YdfJ with MMPL/SSD domain
VAGTLLVLLLLTLVTDVSVFSINLTTGLGVGLGIDYSLFIVSRFRQELHAGRTPADAVVRTVQTAGRTVLFSPAGAPGGACLGSPPPAPLTPRCCS